MIDVHLGGPASERKKREPPDPDPFRGSPLRAACPSCGKRLRARSSASALSATLVVAVCSPLTKRRAGWETGAVSCHVGRGRDGTGRDGRVWSTSLRSGIIACTIRPESGLGSDFSEYPGCDGGGRLRNCWGRGGIRGIAIARIIYRRNYIPYKAAGCAPPSSRLRIHDVLVIISPTFGFAEVGEQQDISPERNSWKFLYSERLQIEYLSVFFRIRASTNLIVRLIKTRRSLIQ